LTKRAFSYCDIFCSIAALAKPITTWALSAADADDRVWRALSALSFGVQIVLRELALTAYLSASVPETRKHAAAGSNELVHRTQRFFSLLLESLRTIVFVRWQAPVTELFWPTGLFWPKVLFDTQQRLVV
jgi:hypothetical protein